MTAERLSTPVRRPGDLKPRSPGAQKAVPTAMSQGAFGVRATASLQPPSSHGMRPLPLADSDLMRQSRAGTDCQATIGQWLRLPPFTRAAPCRKQSSGCRAGDLVADCPLDARYPLIRRFSLCFAFYRVIGAFPPKRSADPMGAIRRNSARRSAWGPCSGRVFLSYASRFRRTVRCRGSNAVVLATAVSQAKREFGSHCVAARTGDHCLSTETRLDGIQVIQQGAFGLPDEFDTN